jgi:hypothetical protein
VDIDYKGKCKWEASFLVPSTSWINSKIGVFRLEIMNTWVNGLYAPGSYDNSLKKTQLERMNCDATPGFSWRGHDMKVIYIYIYTSSSFLSL